MKAQLLQWWQDARAFGHRFSTNPFAWMGLLALLIAGDPFKNFLVGGVGLSAALSDVYANAERLTGHPIFRLAMIPLAVFLFVMASRRAAAAAEKVARDRSEALRSEMGKPLKVIELFLLERKIAHAESRLLEANRDLANYRGHIRTLREVDGHKLGNVRPDDMPWLGTIEGKLRAAARQFDTADFEMRFLRPPPKIQSETKSMGVNMVTTYALSAADNGSFFAAHDQNIANIDHVIADIEKKIQRARERYRSEAQTLERVEIVIDRRTIPPGSEYFEEVSGGLSPNYRQG